MFLEPCANEKSQSFLHQVPTNVIAQVVSESYGYESCQRPYHVEHTSSRPITEVKQHWARIVLGWETAWEHRVLLAFLNLSPTKKKVKFDDAEQQ